MRRGLNQEVIRLHLRHPDMTVSEIAKRIDAVPQYVSATLKRNGLKANTRPKKVAVVDGVTAHFPSSVCQLLSEEARKREISVNRLIRSIISIVARDRMVDAILDDQVLEDAA